MALQLPMQKDGEEVKKLKLSMSKTATFKVELMWESDQDLDAHALLATNDGAGAKVDSMDQVLSTFNSKKTNSAGALVTNADGSFSTPCGTLSHSGDSRTGVTKAVDEFIIINGAKAAATVNEIPIFITIYKADKTGVTFKQVTKAGVRISDDDGKVLCEYELSNEFGAFNAVQMGSIVLNENGGWEFAAVGNGFNGDFNTVLGFFS